MSDPRRLSRDPDNELARTLLRSARARAPRSARQRAVIAATSGLAATSLTATAAGGPLAKAGAIAALKWLGVAGIVTFGAVGAALTLRDPAPSSPAHHEDETRAHGFPAQPSAPPRPFAPPAPTLAPDPIVPIPIAPALPAPFVPAPAPARSGAGASIRDEVATLERARSVLASGEPALALSILDDYVSAFPHPTMASEAAVLRIEALVRAGDRSAARSAAHAFLVKYPLSPYGARVRSVVGPNP
jgi:hypothetical protein